MAGDAKKKTELSTAPPPFPAPPRDYGYYSNYYSPHPPPLPHQLQPQPPRPSYNRTYSVPVGSVPSAPVDFSPSSNDFKPPPLLPPRSLASTNYAVLPGVSGPSAPVDYTSYDQKLQKQFGGLNLEEEEVNNNPTEKKPENNEFAKREDYSYSDYRHARDY
ncbi:hypothetical protein LWI29_036191 [Acer saccharum]|uniref:Uncharacterized protein n=1 Tax=Acer saccharum TaxID=4024 RepID=A0AA39TGV6_ACESA|nr:hypothetical protein LWI29_036191 [Acer saccharum]